MQQLSIKECVRFGWKTFKKRLWFFVGVYAAYFSIIGIISLATDGAESREVPAALNIAVILASIAIGTIIEIALVNLALKAHENVGSIKLSGLFSPMPFWYYLAAKILIGIAVLFGLILLVVPGIILTLMFAFAPYIVVDRALGPIGALKESIRITKVYRWTLLGVVVVLGLLNVAGALALFVGLLVTLPVSALAFVHVYRTLEHRASEVVPTST